MKKKLLSLLVLLTAAVTGAWAQWTGGTYTATVNEPLNAINVSDDATLTINQGVTVTVNGGIVVADGKTLTITGGGTLVAKGANGIEGEPGQTGNAGGTAIAGNVIINGVGLTVTATGGEGGTGGNGGYAFAGTLTVFGGNVNAYGGDSGQGGSYGVGGQGGSGYNVGSDGDFGEDGEMGEYGSVGVAYASNVTFEAATYTMTDGTNNITDATGKNTVIIQSPDVEPAPAGDYLFTVAPCEHGSGKVTFTVQDKDDAEKITENAKGANEGDKVTMTITPDEGWIVDATSVKAESYSTWEAAGAPSRRAPGNIQILGDVTLTKSTTAENTWTFTMPAASVLVGTGYKKVSNLAFKPADKTNLITVEVDNVVKNRDPQDATKNVNIRRIHNLLESNAVKLTANTGYKFRKVEVKKGVDYSFDLSTLTSNFEAMDGDILYGTTDKTVTIPNGAHVTLNGVNITSGAAIVCNGNATITLAAGSENIVTSTTEYNSGIRAGGNNTTLTINGTGKLTVQGAKRGAGIGSNRRGVCGNIVIEDGEIITTTGNYGAGIGSGYHATCGNITIKGGTITATGGNCGAGIGSSFDHAICGDILISGGTITANGGIKAAGIGTGSAQQGWPSTCGNITITDGVTKVTATKGSSLALHSIGKGQNEEDLAACGTVTIGGTEGYISTSPYTYDPHQQ